MQPGRVRPVRPPHIVSILTRPPGRMQPGRVRPVRPPHIVSILTRPPGRMQPMSAIQETEMTTFQSSPGLPAGCNLGDANQIHVSLSFQSSPGLPAGCNGRRLPKSFAVAHSFNPHPASRPDATPIIIVEHRGIAPVSILTRPPGRMQPTSAMAPSLRCKGFQSSPGLPAGCNVALVVQKCWTRIVSILTRPPGRMQQSTPLCT